MKNEDEKCFRWAITRALNPEDSKPERVTKELIEQSEKYNWKGIAFPTKVKDICIWETNNNININLFGFDDEAKKIYTIRIGKLKDPLDTINLFLHDDNHYCVVKNLSKLVSSQLSKDSHGKDICLHCLNAFGRLTKKEKEAGKKSLLEIHEELCSEHKLQKRVSLLNLKRLHDVPAAFYCDLEGFVEPVSFVANDPSKPFTIKYQNHTPSGVCFVGKCMDENAYPTKTILKTALYEGEDMGKAFVDAITEEAKIIYEKVYKNPKPMVMSEAEAKRHTKAKNCYACGVEFGTYVMNAKGEKTKVTSCRDHCHITGKYRGVACDKCNVRMRVPNFIPVLFHNLEDYDSHLFVKSLGLTEGDIRCIPKTDEKYISFSKMIAMGKEIVQKPNGDYIEKEIKLELRFIDSLKFTLKSLDSLVKTLGDDQFETLTSQMIPLIPKETLNGRRHDRFESLKLLKQKGVFPYEYMTDFSKLSATSLPLNEAFYSQLNGSGISDKDYDHAKKVWNTLNCKIMRDYHDLYLRTDTFLLADVMTEFRETCKKAYGLEALHYYTSPGLAWDAMLKITKVKLDLISDPNMYMMIENGIRGGISTVMKRHAESNHKYLSDYDKSKASKFIEYLDANSLYGWAMSQKLRVGDFRWMDTNELGNWRSIPFILEVDLEYPKELHDLHNEYPLAPEKMIPTGGKVSKLIPNLNDKERYVLHHENLKLYTRLGLRITKIHKGITFEESNFMEEYIQLNTDLRTKGTTDFEKDFYKIMNNTVFGKTMENVRNRINVKLVTNEKALNKLVKKSNYKGVNTFHENLVAVHMEKSTVKLHKPIYLGMSILDLSKTLMYKFHYDYMKSKYGNKLELLFTDMDSLIYEIETDYFYKDIPEDVPKWYGNIRLCRDSMIARLCVFRKFTRSAFFKFDHPLSSLSRAMSQSSDTVIFDRYEKYAESESRCIPVKIFLGQKNTCLKLLLIFLYYIYMKMDSFFLFCF